jgi:fibronectin type 3 domain-containing protein
LLLLLAIAGALPACGGGGGSEGDPNTATLVWDAVMNSNLAGYRIYYGTSAGTYDQPLGLGLEVGNVATFTVTGLSSGKRYYFAATAVDVANNESAFSNEVVKDVP